MSSKLEEWRKGPWGFCPECGQSEVHYEGGRHQFCASCGQEWFSDIDYHDVVGTNLAKLYRDRDTLAQRVKELEAEKAVLANNAFIALSRSLLPRALAEIEALRARLEIAMEGIEGLYMNTSTDMPAAWNDEASWYSRQLSSVISRAARLHAALKGTP